MLKEKNAVGVAPGWLEGARATAGEPGAAAEVKRWSAGRKKEVVLRLLRGEPADAVSRELAVPIYNLEQRRDRGRPEVVAMSRETFTGAGRLYGPERVCRVLEFPRSTLYAQQARDSAKVVPLRPQRRGPKPKMPDADLLAAIRADLEASLFAGEGHRKGWHDCVSCVAFACPAPACCA